MFCFKVLLPYRETAEPRSHSRPSRTSFTLLQHVIYNHHRKVGSQKDACEDFEKPSYEAEYSHHRLTPNDIYRMSVKKSKKRELTAGVVCRRLHVVYCVTEGVTADWKNDKHAPPAHISAFLLLRPPPALLFFLPFDFQIPRFGGKSWLNEMSQIFFRAASQRKVDGSGWCFGSRLVVRLHRTKG